MTRLGPNASRREPSRWLPLVVGGLGLIMVIGSALAWSPRSGPPSPGRLVPKEETLTWRTPVESTDRTQGPGEAQARFHIDNVGGSPVRIIAVETSCGCATPTVRPGVIPPGKTGTVEVRAAPLQVGEKVATFTLKTDSKSTPEVVLRLHVIGSRRPPFFAQGGGDLSFGDGDSPAEGRKLYAFNVELKGTNPTPPLVTSELPFLKVGAAELIDERYAGEPGAVTRKYAYDAKLAPGHLTERFAGDLRVIDPWDPRHSEVVRVHCVAVPDLRAIPPPV